MRTPTFVPGASVRIRDARWRIARTHREGDVVQFDVARGDTRATFLAPFDHPVLDTRRVARPVHVRPQCGAAKALAQLGQARGVRTLVSARGARIDLLPYQLEPALAVLDGHRRVLVADQVGLGKTIQAGLTIAELFGRRGSCRVLVVAPASLRDQWAEELSARFSLAVRCACERTITRSALDEPVDRNPWTQPGVWLVSVDYLKQPQVVAGLPLAAWDLVVIDEAHSVSGHTERHDACAELVRRARHALLLTATPHSGDSAGFARLLALGEHAPSEGLTVFRRTRASLGLAVRRHVRWTRVRPRLQSRRLLDALATFEQDLLGRGRHPQREATLLLLSVLRRRALSTTVALERSVERRLDWLASTREPITDQSRQPSFDFGDAEGAMALDDHPSMTGESGVEEDVERRALERLRHRARAAAGEDPKVARCRRLVTRTKEPVVIFTEFRDSLEAVRDALEPVREIAVLHGGQSAADRSEQLGHFLEGRASVLVATDVGGQGLNLQTRSRWIVNLELPWNPARLEQRIGRVDRIGQRQTVHASVLLTDHPMEAPLVESLARRALSAAQALHGDADLDEAAISALTLASSVFLDTPLPSPTPGPHLPARPRTWARAAAANVVVLGRRRAWQSRWRENLDAPDRAFTWTSRRTSRGASPAITFGFGASIVDRAGAEVERHIVAVASVNDTCTVMEAEPAVTALLRSRLERVGRWLCTASHRTRATERAIERHLLGVSCGGPAQTSLFTRRALQDQERRATRAAAAVGVARTRDRWEVDRRELRLGPIELLWVRTTR